MGLSGILGVEEPTFLPARFSGRPPAPRPWRHLQRVGKGGLDASPGLTAIDLDGQGPDPELGEILSPGPGRTTPELMGDLERRHNRDSKLPAEVVDSGDHI